MGVRVPPSAQHLNSPFVPETLADLRLLRSFDLDGRLVAAVAGTDARTYEYDPAGQLLRADLIGVPTETYTYDALGQRATSTDASGTYEYHYDEASRLLARIAPDPEYTHDTTVAINDVVVGTLAGQQPGDTRYTYDDSGRRTGSDTVGDGSTTFTWTPDGRLDTMTGPQGEHSDRTYASDRSLRHRSNGVQDDEFVWDPTTLQLAGIGGSAIVNGTNHLSADGQVLGIDYLGSTTAGSIATSNFYGPYGESEAPPGSASLGYRGEVTIDGLLHLRNRDYDPATGSFLSQDLLDGVDGTSVAANSYHLLAVTFVGDDGDTFDEHAIGSWVFIVAAPFPRSGASKHARGHLRPCQTG